MEDDYSIQSKNETIFMRRAGVGLFWAIGSLFAPFLLLLTPNLSSFFATTLGFDFPVLNIVGFLVAIFIVFWGSGMVHCIWEMIKYHAILSGLGLFLLIIQPIVWFFLTPLILLTAIGVQ